MVWSGRPRQGLMLMPRDGFLIPFSLLWGGFAIFWESTVLRGNAPAAFALFGVPFVLIGLFFIVGRFLLDAWLRRNMIYALTCQRILIVRTRPWPMFMAVNLDRLPESTLVETRDRRGTIRFGPQRPMWGSNGQSFGAWTPALDPTPQFLGIDDAARVFAAVQRQVQRRRE